MNGCPICQGELVSKMSSAGEETYCSGCRNIIVSATLGFKFAFGDEDITEDDGGDTEASDDTGGAPIEQCFLNGLPGWKGPGDKAKCYTYPPGSKKDEDKAKRRASESAYMESREGHVKRLAFDFGATDMPSILTGEEGVPKPVSPTSSLTMVQNPSYPNNFGANNASKKQSIAMLNDFCASNMDDGIGEPTCTNCGGNHGLESPCPLKVQM